MDNQFERTISPGWYGDPTGRAVQRYWNGTAWTPYVTDAQGLQCVDDPQIPAPRQSQPIHASAADRGIVIQNIIQQPVESQPYITVPGMMGMGMKSTATALLLTFFFGPLGLFYVSAGWAIGMFFISLVAIPLTLGLAVFILWPIWMIMAVSMANSHNRLLMTSMAAPQPIYQRRY